MVSGKPGVPGSRGRRGVPGVPGKPGYFKMCYVNLRHKIVESIILPKIEKYQYTIHKNKMHVDLDQGYVILSPNCDNESVQLMALSFVTSMLYAKY